MTEIIDDECIVCYEPTISRTKCNHLLCLECQSLLRDNLCPICRKNLNTGSEVCRPNDNYLRHTRADMWNDWNRLACCVQGINVLILCSEAALVYAGKENHTMWHKINLAGVAISVLFGGYVVLRRFRLQEQ